MLIPPDIRARIRGLRFTSPLIANGAGAGQHFGRQKGSGLEFEQYRAYEPGDEPRRVDWKLYGRSDRFFVREATKDSPLTIWVLIDTTASMAQADTARADYSKLDAAKLLAACLIEIAVMQGEPVGMFGIGGVLQLVPANAGTRQRDRLFVTLDGLSCSGEWPSEARLQLLWERIALDSLIVVISDGFDGSLPIIVERLAAARRQVLSLGIVSCDERDFPFAGDFVFCDPETGERRRVDGAAARADFLQRFAQSRRELAARIARTGARHIEHYLDEPADLTLRRLLSVDARGLSAG